MNVRLPELDELLTQLTEASSVCMCAEDACAAANVPHIETTLGVANSILNTALSIVRAMMEAPDGEGKEVSV
ncbi:MAG: hypothetical protein IJR48_08950 [Oscillibacter sp.]|nr:hypothetical protein [Oscillibacter sp.]